MPSSAGCVILEGSSASGKSYLAKEFERLYPNCKVWHCGPNAPTTMWEYHLATITEALAHANTGGLSIVDRNWPSEEIYSGLFRGGTKIPMEGRILQKLLLKHSVQTVLCLLRDDAQVNDQLTRHRQKYTYPEYLPKQLEVAAAYRDLWFGDRSKPLAGSATYGQFLVATGGTSNREGWTRYGFDVEGADTATFCAATVAEIGRRRQAQGSVLDSMATRNLCGRLEGSKYVFVGDQVNHPDYRQTWPFMAHANSSLFVAEAMQSLGLHEEEVIWTNSDCAEDHLAYLADQGGSSRWKFIALGNKAEEALSGLIRFAKVPHPSFGRRFLGLSAWAALLKAAIAS